MLIFENEDAIFQSPIKFAVSAVEMPPENLRKTIKSAARRLASLEAKNEPQRATVTGIILIIWQGHKRRVH